MGCTSYDFIGDIKETESNKIQSASVGFIGCSNTRQTVYGYRWVGGEKMWKVEMNNLHDYDSGSIREWAKGAEKNRYWEIFDQHLAENPNTTIAPAAPLQSVLAAPVLTMFKKVNPSLNSSVIGLFSAIPRSTFS